VTPTRRDPSPSTIYFPIFRMDRLAVSGLFFRNKGCSFSKILVVSNCRREKVATELGCVCESLLKKMASILKEVHIYSQSITFCCPFHGQITIDDRNLGPTEVHNRPAPVVRRVEFRGVRARGVGLPRR
jgi:hypothetical protein